MAGKKVLIVDDEPNIVEMISVRLKALGYETVFACDGEEAIAKVKAQKPDILILDVLMPKMTGFEALKKIRQDREFNSIPAIIISAKSSMKDFFIGISNVEFLTKPYDPKALVQAIENSLGALSRQLGKAKPVVLIGVEDALIKKVQECLKKFNFQVFVALHEEEAFKLASLWRPVFILSQFWEDLSVLDPKKLTEQFSQSKSLVQTPFFCFCKNGPLALDAMKTFKGDRLITYTDSADLIKKIEELHQSKILA